MIKLFNYNFIDKKECFKIEKRQIGSLSSQLRVVLLTISLRISLWTDVRHLDLGLICEGWCLAIKLSQHLVLCCVPTFVGNNGPVGNDDHRLTILLLKVLLHKLPGFLEGS